MKGIPWKEGACPKCGTSVFWLSSAADSDPGTPRACSACLEEEQALVIRPGRQPLASLEEIPDHVCSDGERVPLPPGRTCANCGARGEPMQPIYGLRIRDLTGQAKAFAEACYAQNTVDELEEALRSGPDGTDCHTWRITPEEWQQGVSAAINELLEQG